MTNRPSESEPPEKRLQQVKPEPVGRAVSAATVDKPPAVGCISWNSQDYALLDFGRGRKLERIGGRVLDRVCPAAEGFSQKASCDWSQADVRLDAAGRLIGGQPPAPHWQCSWGQVVFNLHLTPFGHVGLFPEQAINWNWLVDAASQLVMSRDRPIAALNLFAYTGGSTLALASAGVHVVHVDASAPAIKWGQRNAISSGLGGHPIRWIVDDARKFVRRELRRGKRYDLLVLDPPSYGHGTKGQRWSIESDLRPLLSDCIQLLASSSAALLLTAHSVSPAADQVASWISSQSALCCQQGRLALTTAQAKVLDAGYYVRAWQGEYKHLRSSVAP